MNRNTLNEIYFGKTKDIVNGLRSVQPLSDQSKQDALKKELAKAIGMGKGVPKEWLWLQKKLIVQKFDCFLEFAALLGYIISQYKQSNWVSFVYQRWREYYNIVHISLS